MSAARGTLLAAIVASTPAFALRPDNTLTTFDGAQLRQATGFSLNSAACDDDEERLAHFEFAEPAIADYHARLLVDDGVPDTAGKLQCPAYLNRAEGDFFTPVLTEVDTTATKATFDVSFARSSMLPVAACSDEGLNLEKLFCVYMLDLNDLEKERFSWPLHVDTTIPPRPTISSIDGGDQSLTITVGDIPDDDEVYDVVVQWRPCTTSSGSDGGTTTTSGTDGGTTTTTTIGGDDLPDVIEPESLCGAPGDFHQVRLPGNPVRLDGDNATLENDVEIEVRVLLVDSFGNAGPVSDAATGTPVEGRGALSAYDGAGSSLSCAPSCQTGSGYGAAWLIGGLSLTALSSRRRRAAVRKRGASWLGVVVALLVSAGASAHPLQMSLDVHLGPYVPAIDEEVKASGGTVYPIYKCFWGDATAPLFGIDVDWTIIDHVLEIPVGRLMAGADFRATQMRGQQQPLGVNVSNPALAGSCLHTSTLPTVELTLLEVAPGITYRFDPLLDWFGFPLVPYARVGLIGAGYAFTKKGTFDAGAVKKSPVVNPVGARFGWEGTLGLMLALDFLDGLDPFDPFTIKRARAAGVFDHAYLSAEASYQQVDDFGQPGFLLHPDERLFGTGLPLQFWLGLGVDLM